MCSVRLGDRHGLRKIEEPKADDPEQAKRFAQTVRELEAAGDLNPTEADAAFERGFKKMVPAKTPPKRG